MAVDVLTRLSNIGITGSRATNLAALMDATQVSLITDQELAVMVSGRESGAAVIPVNAALTTPGQLFTTADGVTQVGEWLPSRGGRPLPPPSKVVSRFPSGHGWTGGADDTTTKLYTDRTRKLTTAGTGSSTYFNSPVATAIDLSGSVIRFAIKMDRPDLLSSGGGIINAWTTNGSAAFQVPWGPWNLIANEWAYITINRSQFHVAVGSPVWTSITNFDVGFQDNNTGTGINVWLGAFELLPDLASTYPNGVFILEMDDGYIGQKTNGAPVVGQRGIPVTYNPIVNRFTGSSPLSGMTAADLRTFQNQYGWAISCHAYAGTIHDGPDTTAQLEADFLQQKQWLRANGLNWGFDDYALCPGTGSPVTEGVLMDTLRRNFRSVRVNSGFYETTVPGDQHKLRSILFSGNTNTQLEANIDAIAGPGGVLILTCHDIISGGTNGTSNSLAAIAANNLGTVLDYAAGKGMAFRTRADLMERR